MSDGHSRIRERTEKKVEAALKRLIDGNARHPQHVDRAIAISVSSVVREAGIGRTTLYRYPSLLDQINAVRTSHKPAEPSKRAERRTRQTDVIRELKRQISELLERNLELTVQLSKIDPSFKSNVTPMSRHWPRGQGTDEQLGGAIKP